MKVFRFEVTEEEFEEWYNEQDFGNSSDAHEMWKWLLTKEVN